MPGTPPELSPRATRWFSSLAGLCAVGLLVGCGSLGSSAPVAAIYDLGTPSRALAMQASPPAPRISLASVVVQAPSWLDSVAMQYRRLDHQPTERLRYRDSRWAAPPAAMLQHALAQRGMDAGQGCHLRLHLDEFATYYRSPTEARMVWALRAELRAELRPPSGTALLASHRFEFERPLATPDAAGGALSASALVDELLQGLDAWFAQLDPAVTDGSNSSCRLSK